jgi:tetratricopeptide (TPR) repeat protein
MKIFTLSIFTILNLALSAQIISQPNYAFKSHETLELIKVEISAEYTKLSFEIINYIADGSFCVDKNTSIVLPSGVNLKLLKTENIPNCPESFNFIDYGQKLSFNLVFPPIPKNTVNIDIIENCADACFSMIGVIIDPNLNSDLNIAYNYFEKKNFLEAIRAYQEILGQVEGKGYAAESGIYYYLISSYDNLAEPAEVELWKEKLKKAAPPYYQKILEILKIQGVN